MKPFTCKHAPSWCTTLWGSRDFWHGFKETFWLFRIDCFLLLFAYSSLQQGSIYCCHIVQETSKSLTCPRCIACIIFEFCLDIEASCIWTAISTLIFVEGMVRLVQYKGDSIIILFKVNDNIIPLDHCIFYCPRFKLNPRGGHSLLYFTYTCVRGVFILQKKLYGDGILHPYGNPQFEALLQSIENDSGSYYGVQCSSFGTIQIRLVSPWGQMGVFAMRA